jgi:hypothetical protein
MGDLVDLPICREEVQWSRLQKESQPWEQLDEIIEEIRRLMIRSAEAGQQREAEQRRTCHSNREACNNINKAMDQMDNSRELFGIQVDFDSHAGKLMSMSS